MRNMWDNLINLQGMINGWLWSNLMVEFHFTSNTIGSSRCRIWWKVVVKDEGEPTDGSEPIISFAK